MPLFRIALLLIILGGVTLFALQNLSPSIPLVFLGQKTQALPLAVWVLVAIAAGALTTLVVIGLFNLSNYLAGRELRRRLNYSRSGTTASRTTQQGYTPEGDESAGSSRGSEDDDFDFEEDFVESADPEPPKTRYQDPGPQTRYQDPSSYEVKQQPKTGYRTGSVYSYNYRDNENPAVGRTESVYDAEYRVIRPPYQSSNPQPPSYEPPDLPLDDNDDWSSDRGDDWGFEEDEDWESDR